MSDEKVIDKIQEIIEDIRPSIQMDGGDIMFESFENGIVQVRLETGSSEAFLNSDMLVEGIHSRLTEEIHDVYEVIVLSE